MDTTNKTAVIFDVDGTLVESSRFEDDVYISAIRDVLGDVRIREDLSNHEAFVEMLHA